jgi:multidrug resistance efflux pump
MDVVRPHARRRRLLRIALPLVLIGVVLGGMTWGVGLLEAAAPTIDRQTILTGKVERGIFLRQVQGYGSLVPDEVIWVTGSIDGQVQAIKGQPGMAVHQDTVLFELQNPTLDLDLTQARWDLKSAQVEAQAREMQMHDEIESMQTEIADLEDQFSIAKMESSGNEELMEKGFLPPIQLELAKLRMESLRRKTELRRERLKRQQASLADRLSVGRGQIDQAQALVDQKLEQLNLLKVKAGVEGVLMEIGESVGLGKRVGAGTVLAKVVDPTRLKAELKISEQQARDLTIGLPVSVEVLGRTLQGRLTRIDPAVVGGHVAIDVAVEGTMPQGSRPDLSITGTIDLERAENAVYAIRPVSARANAPGTIFKINPGGDSAVRVPVRYGRSSAVTIEILEGLEPGDEVVVSDMSRWDDVDVLNVK